MCINLYAQTTFTNPKDFPEPRNVHQQTQLTTSEAKRARFIQVIKLFVDKLGNFKFLFLKQFILYY